MYLSGIKSKLVTIQKFKIMFQFLTTLFSKKMFFCGPSMVFTNVYNPRAEISRKDEYRTTKVMQGSTLGANCTIICGVNIGKYAFIGAGAVINKDVSNFALMVGVPAKQIGWMSKFGEKIELPLNGKGIWKCKKTGEIYTLKGKEMFLSGI